MRRGPAGCGEGAAGAGPGPLRPRGRRAEDGDRGRAVRPPRVTGNLRPAAARGCPEGGGFWGAPSQPLHLVSSPFPLLRFGTPLLRLERKIQEASQGAAARSILWVPFRSAKAGGAWGVASAADLRFAGFMLDPAVLQGVSHGSGFC